MALLIYSYVFLLGCCIGSFLNVLVYRIPRKENFLTGRSHCAECGRTLNWYELVPLISYGALLGKCRTCKAHISLRYPIVELLTGLLALLSLYRFGLTLACAVAFAFYCLLLVITLIDWDTMTIPDGLIISLIPVALLAIPAFPNPSLWFRGLGILAVSLPMWLMNRIIPDCFGGGDIKLMAVSGFLLGTQNVLFAAFCAIISGGIYAVSLLIRHGRQKGVHMPFGPFLSAGCMLALAYGQQIISWYLGLFGL